MDPRTCRVKWKHKETRIVMSDPAKAGNAIIFGCYDCKLVALSVEGKFLWKFPTSLSYISPFRAEPSVQETVSLELMLPEAPKEEKERYVQSQEEGGGSQYTVKTQYATSSHYTKRRKRWTITTGWD